MNIKKQRLSSSILLGPVELYVENLLLMKEFYNITLGLEIISQEEKTVSLGKNTTILVVLHHMKDLPKVDRTQAGLYHFAILFSSRGDLARTVYRILKQKPEFFSGSADHLVSEAFYFNDPEGNGIELYYDRDRSEWQWEDNHIKMATLYIDPSDYLHRYTVLEEPNTEIKMGHFHLKVGDIKKAHQFYVKVLGFDITAELSGALFLSVGGYHHHIGLNMWESQGALKRNDSFGLKSVELFLPDKADIVALKQRLQNNNIVYTEKGDSLIFHDPWRNKVIVTSK